MDQPEEQTHSFIIRLWLEEWQDEKDSVMWRGHITHVASGERRYLQTLDGITAFIGPYLGKMGVPLKWRERLRQWLLMKLLR